MLRKKISCFILVLMILFGTTCGSVVKAENVGLTDEQINAINMLNYITVLTQDINASQNSRLYLEEVHSSLINNTYPNAVDSRTLAQLTSLLDTMESYRMIAVKRERLQYIYEQNQAQAIRAAIPNPLTLLDAVPSYRPSKLFSSLTSMAVDSISSYTTYTEQPELQYLMGGWSLNDEEASVLHNSRKSTFAYMVNMVNTYGLPGDLTLTEDSVKQLVQWKNNNNVLGRIRFLESNRDTYHSYGGYWLLLVQSYYENGQYADCIEAIQTYEELNSRIFRKDHEYAKVIPYVISSAEQIYSGKKYEILASKYLKDLLNNIENDDWTMHYYAAQVYIDLSAQTKNADYLVSAYDIVLDNVNYLAAEQQNLNAAYLAPIQKVTVPKGATKDEKKQIENSNKALVEARKVELPPIYEPMLLNCELLFALANELGISQGEQQKIDGILHPNGIPVFLTERLNQKFCFGTQPSSDVSSPEIEFGGTAIILPVICCTNDANIVVTVYDTNDAEPVILTDWFVDSVKRETESDLSTFCAVYTSNDAHNHAWKDSALITIDIIPKTGQDLQAYHYEFTAHGTKNEWFDYLKVWEGHKNNWFDYAKVWENSVIFEQVG